MVARLVVLLAAMLLATPCSVAFERDGAAVYRFDPQASTVRVLVYRGGLFSNAGHNHVLAIDDFTGTVYLHDDPALSGFELSFALADVVLDRPEDRTEIGGDFSRPLSEKDIADTRGNMLGEKGIQADQYPEVIVRSLTVAGALPDLSVTVEISWHGFNRSLQVPVTLKTGAEGLVASGEFELHQKDFGIKPFSAALGTLKVKNELDVRFRLVATPEPE